MVKVKKKKKKKTKKRRMFAVARKILPKSKTYSAALHAI